MPSSALRVVEASTNRLVIVNPPYYWIGLIFLVVGFFLAVVALAPDESTRTQNTRWVGIALATPFLLAGLGITTSRTRILLDRGQDIMEVESRAFGMRFRGSSTPLERIQHAFVETNVQRGRALSVQLVGGGLLRLTGASTQEGYGEAAGAINQFLGGRD